jgi:hypothetical protein
MAVSLKENNWFFNTDQTPHPYLTRSLPAQSRQLFLFIYKRQRQTRFRLLRLRPISQRENGHRIRLRHDPSGLDFKKSISAKNLFFFSSTNFGRFSTQKQQINLTIMDENLGFQGI